MIIDNLIFVVGGFLAGSVLGLIGAGSGIVAVMILAYIIKTPMHQAIAIALVNTGISAFTGTIINLLKGLLDVHLVLKITLASIVFIPIGTYCGLSSNQATLEILYATLTIIISFIMWNNSKQKDIVIEKLQDTAPEIKKNDTLKYLVLGGITGFLSGLLGFSGGVIMVPGLIVLLKQPIKKATYNSVAVIALTAAISIINHSVMGNKIDYYTAILFSIGGTLGVKVGAILQNKFSSSMLKKMFACFLLILGGAALIRRLLPVFEYHL